MKVKVISPTIYEYLCHEKDRQLGAQNRGLSLCYETNQSVRPVDWIDALELIGPRRPSRFVDSTS